MNSIERLTEMFSKFPGIGPRQAKRFVYYLLYRSQGTADELVRAIQDLKREVTQCSECLRYFPSTSSGQTHCTICSDDTREASLLMIVPRDVDLEAVERSGTYKGRYFVLGGVVPVLEKEPEKKIRIKNLESRIKNHQEIKEIILAMNANVEGENTADYLKEKLAALQIKTSVLGRGLATGAELEYVDPETIKNALQNRS